MYDELHDTADFGPKSCLGWLALIAGVTAIMYFGSALLYRLSPYFIQAFDYLNSLWEILAGI